MPAAPSPATVIENVPGAAHWPWETRTLVSAPDVQDNSCLSGTASSPPSPSMCPRRAALSAQWSDQSWSDSRQGSCGPSPRTVASGLRGCSTKVSPAGRNHKWQGRKTREGVMGLRAFSGLSTLGQVNSCHLKPQEFQ